MKIRKTITLEEETINKAKDILEKNGVKLSSLLNQKLKQWVRENELNKRMNENENSNNNHKRL